MIMTRMAALGFKKEKYFFFLKPADEDQRLS
jgi:hypothetical protein